MTIHSRPRAAAASLLLGSALLLTSCGGAGTGDGAGQEASASSSGNSSELVPAAEGNVEYPLTLDTVHGEVEIEERPERVAVLGWNPNIDAAEALGVTPVYVASRSLEYGWMDEEWLDSIEVAEERPDGDLNIEGVAAAEPDVIFMPNTSGMFEAEDIERLSQIAPVVEVPEEVPGDRVDWRDAPELLGASLDLGQTADEAVAEAEDAMTATAEENPQFEGKTLTIAADYGEEYGIDYYTAAGGTAEQITGLLGFTPNPRAEQFVEEATVPEENQGELDADALIVLYVDNALREARESSELFQQIPAVADDRYVAVVAEDDDRAEAGAGWALRRGASVLSLPWTVDALADWANEADLDA
ncbi:MAG: ABC transporter substrate-binding protein [Citricoccus sp.]